MSADLRGAVAALRADPVAARGMHASAGRPTPLKNARETGAGTKRFGYAEAQRQTSGLRGAGHVATGLIRGRQESLTPRSGRGGSASRTMRSGSSGLMGGGMVASPAPRGESRNALHTSKRTGYAGASTVGLTGAAVGALSASSPRSLRSRSAGNGSVGSARRTQSSAGVKGLMNQPEAPAPELLDRNYRDWRSLSPGGKCMAYPATVRGTSPGLLKGEEAGGGSARRSGSRKRPGTGHSDHHSMLVHTTFQRSASCGGARSRSATPTGRRTGLRIVPPTPPAAQVRSRSISNRPPDTLQNQVGLVGDRTAPIDASWKRTSPGMPTKFRPAFPARPPPPPPAERPTGRMRAPSPLQSQRSASPAGRRQLNGPPREFSILSNDPPTRQASQSPSRRHFAQASQQRRLDHYANGDWRDATDGMHGGRRHLAQRSHSIASNDSVRGRARCVHSTNSEPSAANIIGWR
eukprot:TRINITY_DN18498_c1_g1_i1.p1 TRINITY_DN18498_c1_g1~~TRINITY_DN18498_c1_g1_i1.p1  ORF type:complete len:464 (+),score=42.62 TRINITY_DN18498_c1_g1_i1:87-1478(+)